MTFGLSSFLLLLLVFGFAPGAVLRLVLLAFHRDDPRRAEMLAELRAVPQHGRPMWVTEQIEVALFEGLFERVGGRVDDYLVGHWSYTSGVKQNARYPDSFYIPDAAAKADLMPGDKVKAAFTCWSRDRWGERMWIDVTEIKGNRIIATLANDPVAIPGLTYGDRVKIKLDHVIDILWLEQDDSTHDDESAA